MAVAVQNARLYGETVARQRELSILFEAGRIASSSLDLQTVVSNAAGYFLRAVDINGCTVSLWNKNSNTLSVLVDYDSTAGANEIDDSYHRYQLQNYPATYSVVKDRGAVVLSIANKGISDTERDYLEGRGVGSTLLIPLVARDDTIGLVELWSRDPQRRFTQSEIRLTR